MDTPLIIGIASLISTVALGGIGYYAFTKYSKEFNERLKTRASTVNVEEITSQMQQEHEKQLDALRQDHLLARRECESQISSLNVRINFLVDQLVRMGNNRT